jgi:putative ABC transport system permease protein
MRWRPLRTRDEDLERELRSDLELEEQEQRENGLSPEEARYAAHRAFGNATLIREQTHETSEWAGLERLWQDVRYGVRQLARNRRFAAMCIIALALGIGAQTTIYSVIHAVLIDPYPYQGAMRMVHLHLYDKNPDYNDLALDGPQFREFQKSPVLDGAIVEDDYNMSHTGEELPEQLEVVRISSNAFQFFGVPVLLGRAFGPMEEGRVAVLSYGLWKSHYASRVDVIGRSLQLNREDYTIIGVMPQRFIWRGGDAYIPLPYSTDPRRPANVYARLRPGVSDRAVEDALQPMLDAFARETPGNFPQNFRVHLVHINEVSIGRFRGVLVGLFMAVSFLLVLSCANVAILILARGEARQAEIAMRKALGASRSRIVTQLITESVLMSVIGGGMGVLLAFAGIRIVVYLMHPLAWILPSEAQIAVNTPVLVFSLGISVLTGVVCGLWPALRVSGTDLRQSFDSTAHKLAAKRGTRSTHRLLLAVQVAITIVLMACSGAALRKLSQLIHASLGFDPQNLASVNVVIREGAHEGWSDRVEFYKRVREAIAGDPNVVSAAIGTLPQEIFDFTPVSVPGQKDAGGQAAALRTSEEYFSTLSIPLLRGRVWTVSEAYQDAKLALINESMRRRYWPNTDPIGQTLVLNNGVASENAWKFVAPGNDQHYQVIGVVGDTPNKGLDEAVAPGVYLPYSMTVYDGFNVVLRSRGDPAALLHAIKERVKSVDASQAVGDLVSAKDVVDRDGLGRERFVASLFGAFAFLGLWFAASGLFSIQSYLVAQKTRELGLRMALGAGRADIIRQVTRASAITVFEGTAAGLLLNMVLSRTFAQWTNGNAGDPGVLAAMVALLFFTAVAASLGPVLSATSIEPMRALRIE